MQSLKACLPKELTDKTLSPNDYFITLSLIHPVKHESSIVGGEVDENSAL
jgi:hypothetical protein